MVGKKEGGRREGGRVGGGPGCGEGLYGVRVWLETVWEAQFACA